VTTAQYRRHVPALEPVKEQATFGGCLNFRDLGGHLTGTGIRIPARRLFRSDFIAEAWEHPGDALAVPRLQTVIDLRSESECATPSS